MNAKIPISVVVVVKNEEGRIKDCLESVRNWVDEIVVVDDYSSDRTVEIAREYTDRVFQRRWEAEARHRNYAHSLARNEWIFHLDADERVTSDLKKEIIDLFQTKPACDIYTIPIRNYIGDHWIQHGGWYPAGKPRLFKRDNCKYSEMRGYPELSFVGKNGYLKGDILHHSFRNFSHFLSKLNNWTDFEAKKWIGLNRKIGLAKAIRKGWTRFMKTYVSKKGYKDGFIGFMVAFFSGLYQLMTYAKYWEIKSGKK